MRLLAVLTNLLLWAATPEVQAQILTSLATGEGFSFGAQTVSYSIKATMNRHSGGPDLEVGILDLPIQDMVMHNVYVSSNTRTSEVG